MGDDLFVNLHYDVNKRSFEVESNIIEEKRKDIVLDYLRLQMGAGKDDSKANVLDVYEIALIVNLAFDSFQCIHNCGNLGVRDGILLTYVNSLEGEGTKSTKQQ